jgi:catecholate siderophore receptor
VGSTSGTSGRSPAGERARNNFYGFRRATTCARDVDVATAKFEHDLTDSITLRNQLRYGSYSRSFRITEPQSNRGGAEPGTTTSGSPPISRSAR